MLAGPREKLVEDAAIKLLTGLAVNPRRSPSASVEAAEREITADEQQIRELHDMWRSKEISTDAYRKDRPEVHARIRATEKKTIAAVKAAESTSDALRPHP